MPAPGLSRRGFEKSVGLTNVAGGYFARSGENRGRGATLISTEAGSVSTGGMSAARSIFPARESNPASAPPRPLRDDVRPQERPAFRFRKKNSAGSHAHRDVGEKLHVQACCPLRNHGKGLLLRLETFARARLKLQKVIAWGQRNTIMPVFISDYPRDLCPVVLAQDRHWILRIIYAGGFRFVVGKPGAPCDMHFEATFEKARGNRWAGLTLNCKPTEAGQNWEENELPHESKHFSKYRGTRQRSPTKSKQLQWNPTGAVLLMLINARLFAMEYLDQTNSGGRIHSLHNRRIGPRRQHRNDGRLARIRRRKPFGREIRRLGGHVVPVIVALN